MNLSQNMTDAIEAGRDLDQNMNTEMVSIGISNFFNAVRIDEILDRSLTRVAEGKRP